MQQRLSALVVLQALSAVMLLVLAFSAMARIVSHARYTERFLLEPLSAIGTALEDNARLRGNGEPSDETYALLDKTKRFAVHYRSHWQLSGSTNPDALRQMNELRAAGASGLADIERVAVDDVVVATQRLDDDARARAAPHTVEQHALEQRDALYRLMDINLQFSTIARERSEAITRETFWMMAVVGLIAIGAAIYLGLRTRNAIVPRIRQLVQKVRRFQELGVNEPVPEPGSDELTILSHALDVGFAAIAARDRDRDRFLAVMAHELKTPLSNIQGFARAARERPERNEVRSRAIEIISRQADRVVRLVEDLFLVSRAHAHELPFAPSPIMLAPLVERIADEVRSHERNSGLVVDAEVAAPVLADESLLAQALWTMFTYAVGRAGSNAVNVRVSLGSVEVETSIEGFGPGFTSEELARVFEPFSSVGYEGEGGIMNERRNVLGLYLCHEIAKVHGGLVRAFNAADGTPALTLSLPI